MATTNAARPTHHDHLGQTTAPPGSGVTAVKPVTAAATKTAVKTNAFPAVPDTVIVG